MQFEPWMKTEGKKYLEDIDLMQEGCFKGTCTDDRAIELVGNITDHVYSMEGAEPFKVAMICIQYLYEKYSMSSIDCEILGQLITNAWQDNAKSMAKTIISQIAGLAGLNDIDSEDDDEEPTETVNTDKHKIIELGDTIKVGDDATRTRDKISAAGVLWIKDYLAKHFDPHYDIRPEGSRLNVSLVLFDSKNPGAEMIDFGEGWSLDNLLPIVIREASQAFCDEFEPSESYKELCDYLADMQFSPMEEPVFHEIKHHCGEIVDNFITANFVNRDIVATWMCGKVFKFLHDYI